MLLLLLLFTYTMKLAVCLLALVAIGAEESVMIGRGGNGMWGGRNVNCGPGKIYRAWNVACQGSCVGCHPSPTPKPTRNPTRFPTRFPTRNPTRFPTSTPTRVPTPTPTRFPTPVPTRSPTPEPTAEPTKSPTVAPPHVCLNTTCEMRDDHTVVMGEAPQADNWHCSKKDGECTCMCHFSYKCTIEHSAPYGIKTMHHCKARTDWK